MFRLALVVTTMIAMAACTTPPPLSWPTVSQNFARIDPGRELIDDRLKVAKDVAPSDPLHAALLLATRDSQEKALAEARWSFSRMSLKVERVALLDASNAMVVLNAFEETIGQDQSSRMVYALVREKEGWRIAAHYKLIHTQVVRGMAPPTRQ